MTNIENTALYAGVDFGTSGCRLSLIDHQANQVYSQKTAYDMSVPQSPRIWWHALSVLLLACPRVFKQRLEAIAIDGTSGTLLLIDHQGEPSSPTLMYNDTRATAEAHQIAQVAPLDSGAQGDSSGLARLMWLLKNTPSPQPHHSVVHQADWMMGKLSGHFGHSDENNCLKLGYDLIKQQWPDWFHELAIPMHLLPKVHPPSTAIATLDHRVAQCFGLPLNVKVVTGTTDSIAAFIATGANKIGEAVTSLGSTLAIKFISDVPIFSATYGIYSHRLGKHWLVGGASNSGGAVLLKYFNTQQLNAMTPQLQADQPTGLSYYPLTCTGERFPFADPHKKAILTPRPVDDVTYFQAMLEGIADIEYQAYQRLIALGAAPLTKVYTMGGGSQNSAWTQIRQQKLQVNIITPPHSEAAYGSALLAQSLK